MGRFAQGPVSSPYFNRKYKQWGGQASYSGCDIIPIVYGIDATTKLPRLFVVGDIQTLTYSIHRDKGAVRTLGRTNPKSFTRGQRTIAGTIVFSVFDRRALWEVSKNRNATTKRVSIADELPGFDVILYFTNEYGKESNLVLYNLQIADEGQSHSVSDMYIENTMNYVCQDIDLLEPRGFERGLPSGGLFIAQKHEELKRAAGPQGLAFDYSYLEVGTTATATVGT